MRLLGELEQAALFRHHIIHGALNPLDMDAGVFEFSRKIRGPGGIPQKQILTITAQELFTKGRELKTLLLIVNDFASRLIEKFDPENSPKGAASRV